MEYTNLWKLHHALRHLKDQYEQLWQPFCAQNGLSQMQLYVLLVLADEGKQSIGQLAKSTCMAVGNCSLLCKKMGQMDLVVRRRSAQDERFVSISPTAKGAAVVRLFKQQCDSAFRAMAENATPEDMLTITNGLQCLERLMQQQVRESTAAQPHAYNTPHHKESAG